MKFLVMEDYGGEEAAPSTPWLWVKWWLNDEWWLNEWHIMVQHMVWRHPTLMLWWLNAFFFLILVEIHVSSLATFLWHFDSTRYPNIQNLVPSLCHGWLGKSLDGGFSSKVCLICQISQVNSWPKCVKWSFRNMVHKKSSGSSRPFCFSKIAIVGSTPLLGKPISMIP